MENRTAQLDGLDAKAKGYVSSIDAAVNTIGRLDPDCPRPPVLQSDVLDTFDFSLIAPQGTLASINPGQRTPEANALGATPDVSEEEAPPAITKGRLGAALWTVFAATCVIAGVGSYHFAGQLTAARRVPRLQPIGETALDASRVPYTFEQSDSGIGPWPNDPLHTMVDQHVAFDPTEWIEPAAAPRTSMDPVSVSAALMLQAGPFDPPSAEDTLSALDVSFGASERQTLEAGQESEPILQSIASEVGRSAGASETDEITTEGGPGIDLPVVSVDETPAPYLDDRSTSDAMDPIAVFESSAQIAATKLDAFSATASSVTDATHNSTGDALEPETSATASDITQPMLVLEWGIEAQTSKPSDNLASTTMPEAFDLNTGSDRVQPISSKAELPPSETVDERATAPTSGEQVVYIPSYPREDLEIETMLAELTPTIPLLAAPVSTDYVARVDLSGFGEPGSSTKADAPAPTAPLGEPVPPQNAMIKLVAELSQSLAAERQEALKRERDRADALALELSALRQELGSLKATIASPLSKPDIQAPPSQPVLGTQSEQPAATPSADEAGATGALASTFPPAATFTNEPAMHPAPTTDPQQKLVDRAEALLRERDISGARLLLERAMAGGSSRAALLLAQTYDREVLARWRIRGIGGDEARAQQLYSRAAELSAPR